MKRTKEIISDEAVKLFVSQGFDASSMRKNADNVGVTEPFFTAINRGKENATNVGEYALLDTKGYICCLWSDVF